MLELLNLVPDVIWAALLASLLTLSGVVLSNRNSRAQTIAQLQHDSLQRDREREMSLRQDLFLRAAEALARSLGVLMRISNLNIPVEIFSEEISQDSAALSKIQVVATNDTVQAISTFQQELGSASLELLLKRAVLDDRKNSIGLATSFIDRIQAEQDQLVGLMKQLDLEGNADEKLWKTINDRFEFGQTQHAKYLEERNALWKTQKHEHMALSEFCFQRFFASFQSSPPGDIRGTKRA